MYMTYIYIILIHTYGIFYLPSNVLSTEDAEITKTDKNPALTEYAF